MLRTLSAVVKMAVVFALLGVGVYFVSPNVPALRGVRQGLELLLTTPPGSGGRSASSGVKVLPTKTIVLPTKTIVLPTQTIVKHEPAEYIVWCGNSGKSYFVPKVIYEGHSGAVCRDPSLGVELGTKMSDEELQQKMAEIAARYMSEGH